MAENLSDCGLPFLTTGKNVDVLVLQPPRMPITFFFALKLGPYKNVFGNGIPVDQQINIFHKPRKCHPSKCQIL